MLMRVIRGTKVEALGVSTALCLSSCCVVIKLSVNADRDASTAIHNCYSFIDFD